MAGLELVSVQPWTPHEHAAPLTERRGDRLRVSANGTRTCVGGWQLTYAGATPGACYGVQWEAVHGGQDNARDSLRCRAYWGELAPDCVTPRSSNVRGWHYLIPTLVGADGVHFEQRLKAPQGAEVLTLRCAFRWTAKGHAEWGVPELAPVDAPALPGPVKVAVVTGAVGARQGRFESIQENLDFYVPLCDAAGRENPALIVLPEIALQWGLPGSALDLAVPAPGPETEPFADLARRHSVRILLGMVERDGDAVHNSAVLIAPDGGVDGKYRKVHLAVGGESDSGILPGDGFPVFPTEIGRIGCNICMDSSAAESPRMVGLNGADFLLLPIMGDHRADRWSPGNPVYSESRWKAIMRTRAMDNQLCMVVARNNAQGSCVIDRKGDILAWNEGDRDYVTATVTPEDGYRMWNSGCFREVNWMQRRPHVYGEFVDEGNVGSLRR